MGQYYRGVILKKDFADKVANGEKDIVEFGVDSWDYNNGAKLMEHSYIGNAYVDAYIKKLGGEFNGYPFVWCGDYADDIRCHTMGLTQEDVDEKFGKTEEDAIVPYFLVEKKENADAPIELPNYRWLLNYTTKQFVDMNGGSKGAWDLTINPLPLLTCSGNGRGGGDYTGTDMDKVGIWAYNEIGFSDEIPQGFTELVVNFNEEW